MRRVAVVLVTVVVAATLVLAAASALAAPSSPSLEVSPTTARNHELVTVSGGGCDRRARVHILFDGVEVARAWANNNGKFTKPVRVPARAGEGPHTLTATCNDFTVGSVQIQVVPVSFTVSPRTAWTLQLVTVSGSGCERGARVRIFFDDRQIARAWANRSGSFTKPVRIPGNASAGKHWLSARCDGRFLGSKNIQVRQVRFRVSPRQVQVGDTVTASGSGCRRGDDVVITLDRAPVAETDADEQGAFSASFVVPIGTSLGRHWVGASCGRRFIGARSIRVIDGYPMRRDLTSVSRSAVPAGGTVTVSGTECPDKAPTASLDGQPVALTYGESKQGFTAKAVIPAGTAPGKHRLTTSCDAGSAGTTELNVLDASNSDSAAATKQQTFGPKPPSDVALWAGLFAGLALLVASVRIGRRRS